MRGGERTQVAAGPDVREWNVAVARTVPARELVLEPDEPFVAEHRSRRRHDVVDARQAVEVERDAVEKHGIEHLADHLTEPAELSRRRRQVYVPRRADTHDEQRLR